MYLILKGWLYLSNLSIFEKKANITARCISIFSNGTPTVLHVIYIDLSISFGLDKVQLMNTKINNTPEEWIDPDDAPEITEEDLKRGLWAINGRKVSEAEGRAAFASRLKDIAEAQNGTLSNNEQEKPNSGS